MKTELCDPACLVTQVDHPSCNVCENGNILPTNYPAIMIFGEKKTSVIVVGIAGDTLHVSVGGAVLGVNRSHVVSK